MPPDAGTGDELSFRHGADARGNGTCCDDGGGAGSPDVLRKGFVPAIEVNSLDTAKRIARQSDALFPGSASMLATELSSDNLFMLDYDSPTLRSQPALVRLRNRTLSPAALRFVELVRAVESELVAAEGTEHDVE